MSQAPNGSASRRKLRGAFINTARASCSIFESGRSVYECIARSEDYILDYFSLDILDVDYFIQSGHLRRIDTRVEHLPTEFDFWVFNWHFITMSVLPPNNLRSLPGCKFSIVLELEPGDPLRLIPSDAFDGYIALDPSIPRVGKIFPFPRPLEVEGRAPGPVSAHAPVIGSFGFGTPGKGFELLIEAVNREFEAATVRINVPSGAHVDTDSVHKTNYPRYLEAMCRRIAKPTVEVLFTYDFLEPEAVIDWCAANDLNCFMYTRRQPGLSATTDQAIISGRPLLTISNDTFRHIHPYIPAYPAMSLRQAIAESAPAVRRIQQDWSREAFARTFSAMLGSFGLLRDAPMPTGFAQRRQAVTLIAHRGAGGADIQDYVKRLADAVSRSRVFQPIVAYCPSPAELRSAVINVGPDSVVLLDVEAEDAAALAFAVSDVAGPKIIIGDVHEAAGGPFTVLPRRPIVPFYTVNVKPPPGPPAIWLFGFESAPAALEQAVRKIAAEMPAAEILVEASVPQVWSLSLQFESLRQSLDLPQAIALTARPLPEMGVDIVDRVAGANLLVFRDDPMRRGRLEALASLCLITERAVVFSRSAPLYPFANLGTFLEDAPVPELIAMGVSAHIGLLAEYGEWRTAAAVTTALSGAEAAWDPKSTGAVVPVASVATLLAIQGDEAFLQAAFRAIVGRAVDPQGRSYYLGRLRTSGQSREALLLDMVRSPEARTRGTDLPGLPELRQARARRSSRLGIRLPSALARLMSGATRAAKAGRDPAAGSSGQQPPAAIGSKFDRVYAEAFTPAYTLSPAVDAIVAHARGLAPAGKPESPPSTPATPSVQEPPAPDRVQALETWPMPLEPATPSPQVPMPPGEATPAPRAAEGAVFCLVGVAGTSVRSFDGAARHIGRSLIGRTDRSVRFVEWDPTARKLRGLDATVAGALGVAASDGVGHSGAILAESDCKDGDWLFVPGIIRVDLDEPTLVEVDAVMEARRLKLRTAFAFAGADPLRRLEDRGAPAAAHDQYMQALLLADVVVPVSEACRDDLNAVLAGHHLASWGPMTRVVGPPSGERAADPSAWGAYVRGLEAVLAEAADPARRLTSLYVHVDPDGSLPDRAVRFLQSLTAAGVRLVAAAWDTIARRLGPVDDPDGRVAWGAWNDPNAAAAPLWVLTADSRSALHGAAMRPFLAAHGLRSAVLLGASFGEDAGEPNVLASVARADKVLIESSERYDAFYRFLLARREKVHSAEHRFKTLAAPEAQADDAEWSAYARAFRTELATDRSSDGAEPCRSLMSDPYAAFPNLVRRPKLSLCISTYRRAGWLRQNLKNIFSQLLEQRDDLEVLVVDNASPDDTPEVVAPYLHRRDFRYERNRENVGMLGNLRVTAQRARGEYIWIIGDDDLTRRDAIVAVLDALHRHPGLGLVYVNYGYTSELNPLSVTDLPAFLDAYNVLEPACPNEMAPVRYLAAKNENFFTAIYSHVYRRDHGMRAYCQDTSERIFSTMLACIPTASYVLSHMSDEDAYWIGEPSLVVNSNVSWIDYGTLFDLEQLPRAWDLAERHGAPAPDVDRRRSNRLWLIAMMWKEIFEDDRAGNAPYFSAPRVLMRLMHLPRLQEYVGEMRRIYETAHAAGHPAAQIDPNVLFGA